MLDIVFGSTGQSQPEESLREVLAEADLNGTLYFSYPLFDSADGQVSADALLVTSEHGLVLFDLTAPLFDGRNSGENWIKIIEDRQDEIYRNISSKLYDNKDLVKRRKLILEPEVITFVPEMPRIALPDYITFATPETVLECIGDFQPLSEEVERALNATIQRVTTIKPHIKRDNVGQSDSLGAKMREIEKGIANLDAWQKKSAIAYPEGPQRIRGLAGSGKTIVLALKAAYLHARHPEWNIAVTYYSRALKQQFVDLVRRFMFETKKDEPNWSKIRIFHCWGSRGEPGLYSEAAKLHNHEPLSWGEAERKYGNESFDGACKELLDVIEKQGVKQVYDAILIDEAQDLPVSFFRIVYGLCKPPKRIVWAYDELQNLGEYSMASPAELFGDDEHGRPLVTLTNVLNRPPQDIVLPVCYRNTPWALTVAHGIGFGVNRETADRKSSPLVQIFDEPELWTDIGYEVVRGELTHGQRVELKRRAECSPPYYSDSERLLISPEDAVQFHTFDSTPDQANWVAEQIESNITAGELFHRDILVVLPSAWTSRSEYASIAKALRAKDISSHLVGISSSRDEVFVDDSIAVTHIYRAKGNEAPMVYVLNSHECFAGLELAKKRNTLFTAITRSRAWVRVCGIGKWSVELKNEFEKIKRSDYVLDFVYPTVDQIQRMRRIHRDRSEQEQKKLNKKVSEFSDIIDMIKRGEVSLDALPAEFVTELRNLIKD